MDIKKGVGKMKKMLCCCLVLCFTVLGFAGCEKKSADTPDTNKTANAGTTGTGNK